jgi:hypothetical protein
MASPTMAILRKIRNDPNNPHVIAITEPVNMIHIALILVQYFYLEYASCEDQIPDPLIP